MKPKKKILLVCPDLELAHEVSFKLEVWGHRSFIEQDIEIALGRIASPESYRNRCLLTLVVSRRSQIRCARLRFASLGPQLRRKHPSCSMSKIWGKEASSQARSTNARARATLASWRVGMLERLGDSIAGPQGAHSVVSVWTMDKRCASLSVTLNSVMA
jgi:hypothetical protein